MRTPQFLLSALLALFAPLAFAADSTIAISGYVRDNACAVAGASSAMPWRIPVSQAIPASPPPARISA